jgi:hypothetical protein
VPDHDIDNSAVARLSQTKSGKLYNLPQVNERRGEPRQRSNLRLADQKSGKPMGSINVRVGNQAGKVHVERIGAESN